MARRTTKQITKTAALIGPMTGYPNDNYDAFNAAAADLREHLGSEYEILNPTENHNGDHNLPWTTYMIATLDKIRTVDMVVAISGWEKPTATGARMEMAYAISLGIPVFEYVDPEIRAYFGSDASPLGADISTFSDGPRDVVQRLMNGDSFDYEMAIPDITTTWDDSVIPQRSILVEADDLINGARQKAYDHPKDNFLRTANLWNALLVDKLVDDARITEEEVALLMILVKMARLQASPDHRDSLVDIAGYAGTYEKVIEARAQFSREDEFVTMIQSLVGLSAAALA
jgi:hypothetical protein